MAESTQLYLWWHCQNNPKKTYRLRIEKVSLKGLKLYFNETELKFSWRLISCVLAVLNKGNSKYQFKHILLFVLCFYFHFIFSQLHTTHCSKKVLLFAGFLAVSNSPIAAFFQKRNILQSCKFIYHSHVIPCYDIEVFHLFIHLKVIFKETLYLHLWF